MEIPPGLAARFAGSPGPRILVKLKQIQTRLLMGISSLLSNVSARPRDTFGPSTKTLRGQKMITRRALMSTAFTGLLAAQITRPALAQTAAQNDPVAILTAIYTRAAKGKGDGGAAFVTVDKAARAKYLSKSLVALWAKSDAHTPKGDVGPVDFDPVTNSQDPDVKSFKVTPDKMEADKAALSVTMTSHREARKFPADDTVHYDFVREGNAWKIDDIKGSVDGEAWGIRAMLEESLKT
jgi:hypothetical protein